MRWLILALVCWVGSASAADRVDLNQASAAEIASVLSGIGLKRAEQIIAYRERFGPIQTPEELLAIKGIGVKTLEKNRSRMITVLSPSLPTNGLDVGDASH